MSPKPQPPLDAAQRIHATCKHFEAAWRGPGRPQIDEYLTDVLEPERGWLLAELLPIEVELRQGAGEQPTEAAYRQSFPGEAAGNIIAAAFRRCADPEFVEGKTSAECKIEGYEILDVLGRGGMGVVYKARHLRLKRLVALKMILAGAHAGAEHRARFRTEAEMVARLQHPNIVQIFDVGEQDGHPYIAFEFIEGKTLAEFAAREPQPPPVAAELLEALARAMQYAHQHGIVHRDLKPGNVLLTSNGDRTDGTDKTHRSHPSYCSPCAVPKIMDFGLAKDLAAPLDHTSTGTILGTPNYMSPEQAEGRVHAVGPASDVYSLGAILYVLLTGRPPFQGVSAIATLKMVVSSEPVPPSLLQPRLAKDLETICLKCLHKDPARRYQTAGALADDLRRFLNDEPILARASGRIEKTWRLCRRNPVIAALMASVLLVLVAGVVVSSYFAYTASEEAKDARAAKTRAEANAQRARERAYGSDVRLTQRAWEDNLISLFDELLDGQRPARTDDVDVRGFEWHYWRRLAGASSIIGRHPGTVYHVCFSPDGKCLASASGDQTVKVWDAETGKEMHTLKGHTNRVTSVCFSPDGKQIVSASDDQTVKVWDAETGKEMHTLKGHTYPVNSVCFSPDGKQIVSASNDRTVKVWDVGAGQETRTLEGHTNVVSSVCFSPDGKRIVSGSWDKTVKVWDAETGKEVLTLKGHTGPVYSVCCSLDGKRIASGSNETGTPDVTVWDAETGEAKHTLKMGGVQSVCFSPDGKRLATAHRDQMVRVWDAETGLEKLTLKGHSGQVSSLCFSPDGKRLASGGADRTVRVWDACAALESLVRAGHQSQVTCLALSPNGRWLASSGGVWDEPAFRYSAGELRLWDTDTAALPRALAGHSSGVTCVGFSPDGRYLVSGGGVWDEAKKRYTGGEVRLWDPANGTPLSCLKGHTSSVLCLAFSPDSRFLASGGLAAGEVLVRRLPQGQDAFTLPGLSRSVTTLAFSPDGRFLAGGGLHVDVKVWDLTQRAEVATLPGPGQVSSVAYSPDGKQLAVAGYANELVLYNTTTYKEVRRLRGHLAGLTHVVYSPDGRRIATASDDCTVRLWDSSSGQEMLTLRGHTSVVRCVGFSPDGHRLFSGGWDRTIRIWDATPID